MKRFSVADRDRSMETLVSFHLVPMPRMLAFVIRDIETNGAPVAIFSADRTVKAIEAHNREHGTNRHAQQFLFDHQNEPGFNPANSPNNTSHCYFADTTIGLLFGISSGSKLPVWALGIDLSDRGKQEDVSQFMRIAHKLGYKFVQPYTSGKERHHVILVKSPIQVLENRNQISRNRHK